MPERTNKKIKQFPEKPNPLEEGGYNSIMFREARLLPQKQPYGLESTRALPNFLALEENPERNFGNEKILPRHITQTGAALTMGVGHFAVSCDTTDNAIAITLPNAQSVLGTEFTVYFAVDGGNDVTVATDGTDLYRGAAGAGNDLVTFADAHDFFHIIAIANDVWLVISEVGGTYS